jgi:hypothetical protein
MASFNSAEYAWKDITIAIDGTIIGAVREVSYTPTTEHEYLYGRGSAPRAIQDGNETYEGSITLLQSSFEAINEAIKNKGYKNITKAFLTITVNYANIGDTPKTDIIEQVKISEYPKGMAQNDKFMEIEMPFMALGVQEDA